MFNECPEHYFRFWERTLRNERVLRVPLRVIMPTLSSPPEFRRLGSTEMHPHKKDLPHPPFSLNPHKNFSSISLYIKIKPRYDGMIMLYFFFN